MNKLSFMAALVLTLSLVLALKPIATEVGSPETKSKKNTITNSEQIFLVYVDDCLEIIEQDGCEIPMQGASMVAYVPGEKSETWTSMMKTVATLPEKR